VTHGKTTYETYEYDSLGNVIHFFDAGDVGAADDVDAVIGYFTSPFKYIVKPNSIVVTNHGQVMRKRKAMFGANTGEVQEVRQYLADGTAAVANVSPVGWANVLLFAHHSYPEWVGNCSNIDQP